MTTTLNAVYDSLNNLDDIAKQAGSDFTIELVMYYSDGTSMNLYSATSIGCTFCSIDDNSTALFNITGAVKDTSTNTLQIVVPASATASLGNNTLYYRPYIVINNKIIRCQGRLILGATTPIS